MLQQPACKAAVSNEKNCQRMWTAPRVAALCACGILMTVGLVGVFLHFSAPQQQARSSSWLDQQTSSIALSTSCQQLPGRHKQLCQEYIEAVGEERWSAASAWRRGSPDSCERPASSSSSCDFCVSYINVTCMSLLEVLQQWVVWTAVAGHAQLLLLV
jgi:hypothetical protein